MTSLIKTREKVVGSTERNHIFERWRYWKIHVLQSTFPARSPPISQFNALSGVKYLCHTFKYLERPAILESPSNKVFVNCFLKRR